MNNRPKRSDTLRDVKVEPLDESGPNTDEMQPTTQVDGLAALEPTPERSELERHAREHPLDERSFKDLAQWFERAQDAARAGWMKDIAVAVSGKPSSPPRSPRLILSSQHRKVLKHPRLATPDTEAIVIAGPSLCRMYPSSGSAAGSGTEFDADAGPGAGKAGEALMAAVRILGMKAPGVFLAEENGPPFSLAFYGEPKLLVGRLAVRRELSDSELRFYAGRALFTTSPDLMALRLLRKEELSEGLLAIGKVLKNERAPAVDARAIRDGLPAEARGRLNELLVSLGRKIKIEAMLDGARHSVNRAGLVVCGGLGPALHALKAKKALKSELEELVRFAMSEEYFALTAKRV
jgi:hypothetical protein